MADAPPVPIATPCIQVCTVDGPSGLCLGCFRTLPEIARWSKFTGEERAALMQSLPGRRDRIDPAKLGDW
ncbi:MAG: DUF1289 domain-containing protein [Caulobacteraceae bacterium]|nr:MAG: DUF1289 domain-containing protein [Caulobacteraceae bacterium]